MAAPNEVYNANVAWPLPAAIESETVCSADETSSLTDSAQRNERANGITNTVDGELDESNSPSSVDFGDYLSDPPASIDLTNSDRPAGDVDFWDYFNNPPPSPPRTASGRVNGR